MDRKVIIGMCVSAVLFACCTGKPKKAAVEEQEDLKAKEMFQGIWLSDDTEIPLMRVDGDTVYYADPQNVPVAFKIVHDTLYLCGNKVTAYKINMQTENSFSFYSLSDVLVKLHKSENPDDALVFAERKVEVIPTISEVIKKDSVVTHKGNRYHGYVYINPSKMKVIRTSYSEDGIGVDNVYYDNVIHICVYKGKEMLYGEDITKKMFASVLAPEILDQSILSDMDFLGVSEAGYLYRAALRIPESSVYNVVNLTIGFDNVVKLSL